jgi:predicted nucleotidyltransferase
MAKKLSRSKIKKEILGIIKDYIEKVKKVIRVEKVILFGSVAKGKIHQDSDIDLIILSSDFEKIDFLKRLILLSRIRRELKKSMPMDVLAYTPKEFKNLTKKSIILKEAKLHGKIIK